MVKEIARAVEIPEGVAVSVEGNTVTVKGAQGPAHPAAHPEIEIKKEDSQLIVNSRLNRKQHRAMVGTPCGSHRQYGCRRDPGLRVQDEGSVLSLSPFSSRLLPRAHHKQFSG